MDTNRIKRRTKACPTGCKRTGHQASGGAGSHKTADIEVLQIFDILVYMREGIARCRRCDRHFWLELVDVSSSLCLFRASLIDGASINGLLKDLDRGSCDVDRARTEIQAVTSNANAINDLLLMHAGEFIGWVDPHLANRPGLYESSRSGLLFAAIARQVYI